MRTIRGSDTFVLFAPRCRYDGTVSFARVKSTSACSVRPRHPVNRAVGGHTVRGSVLDEGGESTSNEEGWPWIFKQPGRLVADLPGEEVFEGFGGLEGLFDDDFTFDSDDDTDGTGHCKASREVRNACHCQASIDPAPAAELMVLSETGATLTGIPPDAVWASRSTEQGQPVVTRDDSEGDARAVWSEQEQRELALCLTGTRLLKGSQPLASSYGGHQFGNWAGQLGDGRVATLGELRAAGGPGKIAGISSMWDGSLVEIQLKGIGKTPFSRGGDGKAVLGACLREYLFSEAFIGLGLGAAVAVSVCSTGQNATIRDSDPSKNGALKRAPGAVLCRAAPSFLRFGSFELPARRGEVDTVRTLADFCLRHVHPHLLSYRRQPGWKQHAPAQATVDQSRENPTGAEGTTSGEEDDGIIPRGDEQERGDARKYGMGSVASQDAYLDILVAIVQSTARMVANWQALGFCHGVLNTDNFTLLGLGLDFGPCRFMEEYDPAWSPNDSDSGLRYTFQSQPDVSAWNCERLAEAFSSLVGVSGVARANEAFSPAFDAAYTAHVQRKLGLSGMELGNGWIDKLRTTGSETFGERSSDAQFVSELFRLMASCRADFTRTWRALIDVPALSLVLHASELSSVRIRARAGKPGGLETSPSGPVGDLASGLLERNLRGAGIAEDGDSLDAIDAVTDREALRPVIGILNAAAASNEQMHEWADWVREYMARIDSQGVGRLHPNETEGRRQRLETMRASNPAFVLRSAALECALEAAEEGDMAPLRQLEQRLCSPYTIESCEQPLACEYRQPPAI